MNWWRGTAVAVLVAGLATLGNGIGQTTDGAAAQKFAAGLAVHYYRDVDFWGGNWPDKVSVPKVSPDAWTFTKYAYTRTESYVNHLFVRRGWFSVRWKGYLETPAVAKTSATYYLMIWADDGCRLWLDGRQVVNSWAATAEDSPRAFRTFQVLLPPGKHKIQLDYFQGQSLAESDYDPMKFFWASPELNMPIQIVGPSALSHKVDDLEPDPGRTDK